MKNSTKILIGVVVVALVGAGVYFGNTKLQKGSFQKFAQIKLADLSISSIYTPVDSNQSGVNLVETDGGKKIWWGVRVHNNGTACAKNVTVELRALTKENKIVNAFAKGLNPTGKFSFSSPTSYTFTELCPDSMYSMPYDVIFLFGQSEYDIVAVNAVIDRNNTVLELNETNNYLYETGYANWTPLTEKKDKLLF